MQTNKQKSPKPPLPEAKHTLKNKIQQTTPKPENNPAGGKLWNYNKHSLCLFVFFLMPSSLFYSLDFSTLKILWGFTRKENLCLILGIKIVLVLGEGQG